MEPPRRRVCGLSMRLQRTMERCFKWHKRGADRMDTDKTVTRAQVEYQSSAELTMKCLHKHIVS